MLTVNIITFIVKKKKERYQDIFIIT